MPHPPRPLASPRHVPPLHLITDGNVLRRNDFPALALRLLTLGGAAVALHLRDPGGGPRPFLSLAAPLVEATRDSGGRVLVNDRVDVVLAVPGSGAHLRETSIPSAQARKLLGPQGFFGRSVHAPTQVQDEVRLSTSPGGGADYLLLGTIFPTSSHPGVPGGGVEQIRRTVALSPLPLIAIGGMTLGRVEEVKAAGAAGIGVLRGIWDTPSPEEALEGFLSKWEAV